MADDSKGIMLCDRPPGPAEKMKKAKELKGFHLGSSRFEPLGVTPIPKIFPMTAALKVETALQKHVKFLRTLAVQARRPPQEKEKALEAAVVEEEEAARRRQVAEDAAAIRRAILFNDSAGVEEEAAEAADAASAAAETEMAAAEAERRASNGQAEPATGEEIAAAVLAMKRSKPPKHSKPKPAWALTADQAEEEEVREAEALLTFAQTLDFDEYLGETEKKDLGRALKTLAELEFEEEMKKYPIQAQTEWAESFVAAVNALVSDDARKGPAGGDGAAGQEGDEGSVAGGGKAASVATSYLRAKAKAAAPASAAGWDSSTVADSLPASKKGDASLADAAAEDLLREHASFRAVHSKQSVARMVEAAAAAAAIDHQPAGEQALS